MCAILMLMTMMTNTHIMVFPANPPGEPRWEIVNDDVMGGISISRFSLSTNGSGIFEGTVSLENNGGFASVRLWPATSDLSGCTDLLFRVRGDGRRYKIIVRTDSDYSGVNYQGSFETEKEKWEEHRVALEDLVPTFRGRVLTDQPKCDAARIATVGFLIGDKQPGPFRLEIAWIKAAKRKQ